MVVISSLQASQLQIQRRKMEVLPTLLSPTRMILYLGPLKADFYDDIKQNKHQNCNYNSLYLITYDATLQENLAQTRKAILQLSSMCGDKRIICVSSQQIIPYMQVDQKLLKKASRSAKHTHNSQQAQKIKQMEDLLRIDLITLPNKKTVDSKLRDQSSRQASRKSHKSLAVNIQKIDKALQAKLTNPKQVSKTPNIATNAKEKQEVKTVDIQNQKHQQSIRSASYQYEYVEKKLKVGKKTKSNAMKEFILQTLNKAKAQGNCLVIHKGTAQSNYSPLGIKKEEASKKTKEQYPLVLVQAGNADRRQKKSIFGGSSKKINKNGGSKSTAINLPTVNKKWVKMAREYEKKGKKQQKDDMQVIEQKIQANEDEKIEQIKEEIYQSMVPNQSIIRQQIISKQ